jgi:FkbM family methyltransferase
VQATSVEPLLPEPQQLDRDRVVEARTEAGTLWLERGAELMTPAILQSGNWADELTMLMRSVLRPGMTFVDAGANVGYLSVLGSRLVGPSGRVVCVEADPANVEILRTNLWRNDCSNARIFQVAAWDRAGELNLVTNPAGGAGSTVDRDPSLAPGVPVTALRLDELIDGRVDCMKVDCEGTDHRVIDGAAGLIRANPAMVLTVEHMAGHAETAVAIYRRLGLRPFEIRGFGRLEPTTFERIVTQGAEDETIVFDHALSLSPPRRLTSRSSALRRAVQLTASDAQVRKRTAERIAFHLRLRSER